MASGIEEILTTLYEMVQDAWSLPLGADKCVLERDKVLDLLDEISNQLPGELKQAKTIVESRSELITSAKREAEGILKQAQAQGALAARGGYNSALADLKIVQCHIFVLFCPFILPGSRKVSSD